jgi:dTDP-glucose 4,6-dehydratase
MILVTGGAGFIGGNYLWHLSKLQDEPIICVDKLTSASNYDYIKPLVDNNKVFFYEEDICSKNMKDIFELHKPNYIVNFAAESHVDNSIQDVTPFIESNILGTVNLLNLVKQCLPNLIKFVHISTDEVYGSLELDDDSSFKETTQFQPNNPYSASKASAEHFVRAFHKTHSLPTVITNCSNNYGPNQANEKLIPTIFRKALSGNKIPVYGDGKNVRDWLFVEDHCHGIQLVLEKGVIGEKYNIGGGIELSNIDLVKMILNALHKSENMIEYVTDRAGHDRKYSINCDKITKELGYKPKYSLEEGLKLTMEWYTK